MSPRRVVAALHLGEPSGPSRSLGPTLRQLSRTASVTIAVPERGAATDEIGGGAVVVELGHGPLVLPRGPGEALTLISRFRGDVRRFRGLLRRADADLAIVATTSLPACTLAARLEGVATIVYAAELFAGGRRTDGARRAIRRAVIRVNARLASVVVPCSHAVARELPPGTTCVVVHPVVDARVARGDADALRRRHGIPAGGPVLATIGSLSFGRGQDTAIQALAALLHEYPTARLIVAGASHPHPPDVAYGKGLRAVSERLGVAGRVHLCGFERTADVLAACDVFVNPARGSESFGIAATEALVAGRPVVSTDVGAIPEILEHEHHALLVPPDRPDAMAGAVQRLLADPALAARLVAAGREHVLTEFSAERQLPRFDEAIALALASAQ